MQDRYSSCFTKSYGKLFIGAGSVLITDNKLESNYKDFFTNNFRDLSYFNRKIRYFSPDEILKFLGFGTIFSFPLNYSSKSKFKLLGNSLNINVIKILLKYLLN